MSTSGTEAEAVFSPLHEQLLGNAPRIQEVRGLVNRLAQVDLTVLVTGETGTGKDIVARLLHKLSRRYKKPFIKVNCPSIPEGILESELLVMSGARSRGAHTSKPGRFELANEGTLFLDEVSETSMGIQAKLLQVLDGEPFLRIGAPEPIRTDVRVIAATNLDPEQAVLENRLRRDVAFRLSEVVVHLPPLRERREDISLLAEHFNYNISKMLRKEYCPLDAELVAELVSQAWPGNVRELAGRLKKYVATGSEDVLLLGDTPKASAAAVAAVELGAAAEEEAAPVERTFVPLREAARRAAEKAEKELIEETLRYTLWNRRKAARLLQTSYSSLLRRIDAYKIGR